MRSGLVIVFLFGALAALVFASYDICDVSDARLILGVAGSAVFLGGAAWALAGRLSPRRWVPWAAGVAFAIVGGFGVLVLLIFEWVNQCTA